MPIYIQLLSGLLFALSSCTNAENSIETKPNYKLTWINTETIRGISLPPGFTYVDDGDSSYSNWLLDLKLKKSKTVYLYNGKLKSNQDVQYGVLNIDIGKKDLLQCADAAMKLRADHLFEKARLAAGFGQCWTRVRHHRCGRAVLGRNRMASWRPGDSIRRDRAPVDVAEG